jgi:ubiquinone/menaquinone biosynthesis C-methylase UbiE
VKLDDAKRAVGRRFARVVTNAVVARPRAWRLVRGLMRRQFDSLAPQWTAMRSPDALAAYHAALGALPAPPRRALDLGTGTGLGAFALAERFPEAQVVGADVASRMIDEARRATPAGMSHRVRFEVADASQLPYPDASYDLVTLANMIPFFDELARVVAPGGHVIASFSSGASTPIYVPPERLRDELSRRGFTDFADFEVGPATALLARREMRA